MNAMSSRMASGMDANRWPVRTMTGESLVLVVRPKDGTPAPDLMPHIREANRKLPDWKRIGGVLAVDVPFPRTATLKVKRRELALALGLVPRERLVDL